MSDSNHPYRDPAEPPKEDVLVAFARELEDTVTNSDSPRTQRFISLRSVVALEKIEKHLDRIVSLLEKNK